MMRQNRQNQYNLEAVIKSAVFKEILASMTKNIKQGETVYFLYNHKQMKICLRQQSKTTELELILTSQSFQSYCCRGKNQSFLLKFTLDKFLHFQSFFEFAKQTLRLNITDEILSFIEVNGKRFNAFPVKAETIDQQEKDDLIKNGFMQRREYDDKQSFCKLKFNKAKLIQEVIRAGNTMKIDKIFISYLPKDKIIKFGLLKNDKMFLQFKIQQQIQIKGTPVKDVIFPFRKLKLAMGLLEAQKPFIMLLNQDSLEIKFDQQNKKKFSITVCSLLQDIDNFA